MQFGKFNILLDAMWGSSGKGKMSTWLCDRFNITNVSSSNFPNAGHTSKIADYIFVAKAIPTAMALKHTHGMGMVGWLSPASGISVSEDFKWDRLVQEWIESGKPQLFIHSRASIVSKDHVNRERKGAGSTKHLASTMQGCSAALVDKIVRKKDCLLAGSKTVGEWTNTIGDNYLLDDLEEFISSVQILDGMDFRSNVQQSIKRGTTWLHEGSQGYALSIDHGSSYPACTSRNCTAQKAMEDMAIPPSMVGDIYLNLRTYPIRVGNVIENGVQVGYSGDFYPDCEELTWGQVAKMAGMPPEEASKLTEREKTTVTKRIRRVTTQSYVGLRDAVASNGATKLILNFVQYLDWQDHKISGTAEAFKKLSRRTRQEIDKIEEVTGVPVVLIGTGADHNDVISLL